MGRFISPDSVVPDYANPQDLNRYSYVRGNPVRFTDPSGHALECGIAGSDCRLLSEHQSYGGESAILIAKPSDVVGFDLKYNYGVDTKESENWSKVAYSADIIDFGFTTPFAIAGLVAIPLTDGFSAPLVEATGFLNNLITTPVGTYGLYATYQADRLSSRTSIRKQEGVLAVSIGIDTIINLTTWILGDANQEIYTSSVPDTVQLLWDSARKAEKNMPDSFVISFHYGKILHD